jgi:hypothetical protein
MDSSETHTHTYEDLKKLAQRRGDPRVPDAPIDMYNDQLGQIYDYILTKNTEDELLKDATIHRYCSDDESDNDNESDNQNDNDSDTESDNDERIYGKKTIIGVFGVCDYLRKKGLNNDAENHLLSRNIHTCVTSSCNHN